MPSQITLDDIGQWQKEVLLRIKPTTWNNYMRHLKAIYNFGIEHGLLKKPNPFSAFFIREGKRPKKTYTNEQLQSIKHSMQTPIRLLEPFWFVQTIVATFALTAIRRGQLLKLKIENIDLNEKLITIPSEINKTHNQYKLPIHELLYPKLEELLRQHKKRGTPKDQQLFNINIFLNNTRRQNREMNDSQLSTLFANLSKHLGFKVSPHRFRHTIATNFMKNPQNVYLVKEILGHSSLAVTLSYIEQDPENLRDTINKIMWY